MLTRMYMYSTSTKLSIDVWLYLDRPGSLKVREKKCLSNGKSFVELENYVAL